MQIRPYDPADEAQVIALWRDHLPGGWEDPADSLRRKLAAADGLLLVAADQGPGVPGNPGAGAGVLGTAMGGYDGHRGWIYAVCVHPAHRRQAIGSKLLRALEAALRQRGAAKINLQVRATNAPVVAFYQSLGYLPEDRISMGKRI